MKSVKYLSITFSLLLFYSFSFGQFALTQSSNAQQLGQALVGSGVQTSNFTMTCGANGAGLFTNGSNNLGIMNGIVLTTGLSLIHI